MTYRSEESSEVYRDAAGVPVERRVVTEPVAYGESVPYAETTPLPNEVVRERVVEQPSVAAPVRNEVVRERVVEQPYA
ncbi:MAG: hypothetical protein LC793_20695, partial [Thermomicrobia bacterium]|nr:hypothetical protein [Thermomicrobia bacterium]